MISKLPHPKPDETSKTLFILGLLAIGGSAFISLVVYLINDPALLAVAVAGLIVVAAIAIRLEIGLFVLVFITYTRFSDVLIHEHGLPSIAQPLLLLLLVIVAIRWSLLRENLFDQIDLPIIILGLYGLVSFSSMLYAIDTSRTISALSDYIKDVIITILIIILLRRTTTFRNVIWVLLLAGIFMGSITTFQQITGTFETDYWGFGQANVQNIIGQSNDYRIAGPIGDPNFYSQILLVLIPLALDRLWHERNLLLRGLAAWALTVCLLSTLFTFSRGAFLGLILVGALFIWHYRIRFMPLLITLLLGGLLAQFVPDQYFDRVQTITSFIPGLGDEQNARNEISFRGRISEMQASWLMFEEHPLLGVGLDNYAVHYRSYTRRLGIDARLEDRAAHNLYLEVAAETGLLGLATFGTILTMAFVSLVKAYKKFEHLGYGDEANMLRAFMIGFIGYLATAFFLHAAYPRYLWLLLGIALAASQLVSDVEPTAVNQEAWPAR